MFTIGLSNNHSPIELYVKEAAFSGDPDNVFIKQGSDLIVFPRDSLGDLLLSLNKILSGYGVKYDIDNQQIY